MVRAEFEVGDDGTLSGGRVFADGDGGYDGMRPDDTGRVWAVAGAAVHCHAPDGGILGRLHLPENVANLVFGGPKRNRLFISASSSRCSLMLTARPVRG